MSNMDNIDKKSMSAIERWFDRAEKFVELAGKLILKIVTGVVGIILAVVFAWGQVHDTLDDHGIHAHSEDEEFQEYLMEIETSAGYAGEVDSLYEDSLYNDYYSLDTIVEDTADYYEEDIVELDTVVPEVVIPEIFIQQVIVPDFFVPETIDTIN